MKAIVKASPSLKMRVAPAFNAAVAGAVPDGATVEVDHLVYEGGVPAWAAVRARLGELALVSDLAERAGMPMWWYLNPHYLQMDTPAPSGLPTATRIPWFSQLHNTYANDCGPACWAMLAAAYGIQTSVDALVRLMGVRDQYTRTDQAVACWIRLGLRTDFGKAIVEPPFLCLVHYSDLPERYDKKYQDNHWIVVVDADMANDQVVYHDPLWPTPEQGAYKRISIPQFHAAEVALSCRACCWA